MKVLDENETKDLVTKVLSGELVMCYAREEDKDNRIVKQEGDATFWYCTIRTPKERKDRIANEQTT